MADGLTLGGSASLYAGGAPYARETTEKDKDKITTSGSENPYAAGVYSAGTNEKNTLTIESFFKLLAAQLANQDMTSPMSNSEMMAQMTNMAMVQSLTAMTDSMNTSTTVTTQTYAAGMVGQEITVAVLDKNTGQPTGVKYGKVATVDFTAGMPVIRLEGDDTGYSMSQILGVGEIRDPYNKDESTDKPENTEKPSETDKPGGTEKPSETDKTENAEKPSETDKPGSTEQPTDTEQSGTMEKPSDTEQNGTVQQPSDTEQNGATQQPSDTEQSGGTEKPSDTEQNGTVQQPTDTEQNGTAQQPADTEQSGTEQQPAGDDTAA